MAPEGSHRCPRSLGDRHGFDVHGGRKRSTEKAHECPRTAEPSRAWPHWPDQQPRAWHLGVTIQMPEQSSGSNHARKEEAIDAGTQECPRAADSGEELRQPRAWHRGGALGASPMPEQSRCRHNRFQAHECPRTVDSGEETRQPGAWHRGGALGTTPMPEQCRPPREFDGVKGGSDRSTKEAAPHCLTGSRGTAPGGSAEWNSVPLVPKQSNENRSAPALLAIGVRQPGARHPETTREHQDAGAG